jgi:hopanoid-associated phosphorylase
LTTIGILTGIAAEARLARRVSPLVTCSASISARAPGLVDAMLKAGATALVSFGIAGALAPDVPSGTLIVATQIMGPDDVCYHAHPGWRQGLQAQLPGARAGVIYGGQTVIATLADKAALFAKTGALAVDMESLAVARAAQEAGMPFGVIRAVADPAHHTLPPAALVGLNEKGEPAIGPVLRSLARSPRQLPALMLIALDTRRAMQALLGSLTAVHGSHRFFDMA